MGTDHDEKTFAGQWMRRVYAEAFRRLSASTGGTASSEAAKAAARAEWTANLFMDPPAVAPGGANIQRALEFS